MMTLVSPDQDVMLSFFAGLQTGSPDVLLLDKALTKAARDKTALLDFLAKLEAAVAVDNEGREHAVVFMMGKYGVSTMARLLLMIDDDEDWGLAASETLERIRLGFKSYNFEKLSACLSDQVVDVRVFATHAHAKMLLTTDQKTALADAFVRRYPVGTAEAVMPVLFQTAGVSVDFDLKMGIANEYAKTEAGLQLLLGHVPKVLIPDVLLLGISHRTLQSETAAFASMRRWICGEHGAGILKAMYVKKAVESQAFIRLLGDDTSSNVEVSGFQGLVAIAQSLIHAMAQGLDQGLATRLLIRDSVLVTSSLPATGPVSEFLLQQTIEAGFLSGATLSETALLNGLGKPVSIGDCLEKLVLAGQATRVGKDPLQYHLVIDDALTPVLESVAIETYGVSVGAVSRVVSALIVRLQSRPIYDALLGFIHSDFNFLQQETGYKWVPKSSAETVNVFVEVLNQRLLALGQQVPRKVIGSAGNRYEKVEKPQKSMRLPQKTREAYRVALDTFDAGKQSFVDLMRVLEQVS
jgi:hypothetical protein